MKKLLILSCCIGISSIQAQDQLKNWTVFGTLLSDNYTLPAHFENIKWAYKAGVQYNLTPNLYVQAKGLYSPSANSKWATDGVIGYAYDFGILRPYVETGIHMVEVKNRSWLKTGVYDVGCAFAFNQHVIPYLESDNFLSPQKEGFVVGVNIPIVNTVTMSLEYSKNVENEGEIADVKIAYNF